MTELGITSIAAITVIAYIFGAIVKASNIESKWIPIVCGVVGAILGAVAMMIGMPAFPATDYLTAIAVGAVSGFAATGINQAGRQLIDN